jgi:hypothetical protein
MRRFSPLRNLSPIESFIANFPSRHFVMGPSITSAVLPESPRLICWSEQENFANRIVHS